MLLLPLSERPLGCSVLSFSLLYDVRSIILMIAKDDVLMLALRLVVFYLASLQPFPPPRASWRHSRWVLFHHHPGSCACRGGRPLARESHLPVGYLHCR